MYQESLKFGAISHPLHVWCVTTKWKIWWQEMQQNGIICIQMGNYKRPGVRSRLVGRNVNHKLTCGNLKVGHFHYVSQNNHISRRFKEVFIRISCEDGLEFYRTENELRKTTEDWNNEINKQIWNRIRIYLLTSAIVQNTWKLEYSDCLALQKHWTQSADLNRI